MYIYYTKNKNLVVATSTNMGRDLFNNTDNIEEILNTYNEGLIIKSKIKEYSNNEDAEENKLSEANNLKINYLQKMKMVVESKLLNLFYTGKEVYSEKKESKYVHPSEIIKNLNNKLLLIDFYLEIRNALINKDELNINFYENENQSKKLRFINLCVKNYNNP